MVCIVHVRHVLIFFWGASVLQSSTPSLQHFLPSFRKDHKEDHRSHVRFKALSRCARCNIKIQCIRISMEGRRVFGAALFYGLFFTSYKGIPRHEYPWCLFNLASEIVVLSSLNCLCHKYPIGCSLRGDNLIIFWPVSDKGKTAKSPKVTGKPKEVGEWRSRNFQIDYFTIHILSDSYIKSRGGVDLIEDSCVCLDWAGDLHPRFPTFLLWIFEFSNWSPSFWNLDPLENDHGESPIYFPQFEVKADEWGA